MTNREKLEAEAQAWLEHECIWASPDDPRSEEYDATNAKALADLLERVQREERRVLREIVRCEQAKRPAWMDSYSAGSAGADLACRNILAALDARERESAPKAEHEFVECPTGADICHHESRFGADYGWCGLPKAAHREKDAR